MKFKKLLVLIAVFSVLLALVFIKKSQETKALREESKSSPAVSLFEDLATSRVSKVAIQREAAGSGLLVLRKDDSGNWTADKPFFCRVNKGRMDTLLKSISELKGEIRSESKEVLKDYKIADGQAWRVLLSDGEENELAHVLISPKRVWGARNFVRKSGSANVLSTETDLLAALGIYSEDGTPDLKSFSDLKINNWDSGRLTRLEIFQNGATSAVLSKREDPGDKVKKWYLETAPSAPEADKTTVEGYLSNLVNWYASEAVDPARDAQIDFGRSGSPWIRATLKGEQADEVKEIYLSAKPDSDKKYQVKILPEKLFFNVPESALANFQKDPSSFLKDKADAKKT